MLQCCSSDETLGDFLKDGALRDAWKCLSSESWAPLVAQAATVFIDVDQLIDVLVRDLARLLFFLCDAVIGIKDMDATVALEHIKVDRGALLDLRVFLSGLGLRLAGLSHGLEAIFGLDLREIAKEHFHVDLELALDGSQVLLVSLSHRFVVWVQHETAACVRNVVQVFAHYSLE